MADARIKKVRYRKSIMHSGEINGSPYREYEYDWHKSSISHVKRFHSCLLILIGVEGCERNLIDWLVDNMTTGNYVTNSKVTRKSFINFYKKCNPTKKPYAENTVRTAFHKLSSLELLIPVTRGTFLVNPEYFFAGTDEARFSTIKMVMEFKSGISTDVNLDITEKK